MSWIMCQALLLGAITQPPPPSTFSRASILRIIGAGGMLPALPQRAMPLDSPNELVIVFKPDLAVVYKPPVVEGTSSREATSLARHLTKRGVKMYGTYWCPNCAQQKISFGLSASQLLDYVECAEDGYKSQRPLCRAKAVPGYPTWEIDGELFPGKKTLEELAVLTGFCGLRPGFCGSSTPEEVAAAAKEVFRS